MLVTKLYHSIQKLIKFKKGGLKMADKKLVYTVPEVAQLLGINHIKMYKLVKRADFPSVRIGRRIVIPKAAFERWLENAAFDKQSYDMAENL